MARESENLFGSGLSRLGIGINLKCYLDLIFRGRGTPDPLLPTTVLVVKGIYKYVRNPVYIGFFLILFGEAIFFKTALLLIYSFLWLLLFNLIIIFIEEPSLKQRFGESYIKYVKTVPRWIPRFTIHRDNKSKTC